MSLKVDQRIGNESVTIRNPETANHIFSFLYK